MRDVLWKQPSAMTTSFLSEIHAIKSLLKCTERNIKQTSIQYYTLPSGTIVHVVEVTKD